MREKQKYLCKFCDKVNCVFLLGEISSHLIKIVKMTVVKSEWKKINMLTSLEPLL